MTTGWLIMLSLGATAQAVGVVLTAVQAFSSFVRRAHGLLYRIADDL